MPDKTPQRPYVRERAASPGEELPERPNETAARERLYARRHARIGVPVPSDEALEQYAQEQATTKRKRA